MVVLVLVGVGQKGKYEMLRIFIIEISRVEKKIFSDFKFKKMVELQFIVVIDFKNKQVFFDQVNCLKLMLVEVVIYE